jgi:seryl-tRNA synthetase
MLQIGSIRENTDWAIAGLTKRNFPNPDQAIARVLELDKTRREWQVELDSVLATANSKAKEIGALMKAGNKAAAEQAKQETADLKIRTKELEGLLKTAEASLFDELVKIPNIPQGIVPAGKSADDNEIVWHWGELPTLPEGALPHWELIKKLDIIDFELGNKVSGAGFPVYKKQGARLQRAMISFFLDQAVAAGYSEIQPPLLVNADSGFGTGQLPDKEGQMYEATADGLYLIPTAEVPITNLYRDVILSGDQIPVKNVGHTPCFRREAGSWGAHVRGLNRLHQFDKVEIVRVEKPEDSDRALQEMVDHVKSLLEALGLPYRILRLCGGDMGFTSAITYDFEVWSSAQERWLECSSVSNFETYQSNRLKLRYRVDGKTQLLHTLNGSALALPRILAALLENNQNADGSINIPDVLVPYTRFDRIA